MPRSKWEMIFEVGPVVCMAIVVVCMVASFIVMDIKMSIRHEAEKEARLKIGVGELLILRKFDTVSSNGTPSYFVVYRDPETKKLIEMKVDIDVYTLAKIEQ
jgi:hypothetical protein